MKTLFVTATVFGLICCAQDSENAGISAAEFIGHPVIRVIIAALVMSCVEALKQWPWFKEKVLTAPIARSATALLLSLPAALALWSNTGDVEAGLLMLGTTWLGAMGINGFYGAVVNK